MEEIITTRRMASEGRPAMVTGVAVYWTTRGGDRAAGGVPRAPLDGDQALGFQVGQAARLGRLADSPGGQVVGRQRPARPWSSAILGGRAFGGVPPIMQPTRWTNSARFWASMSTGADLPVPPVVAFPPPRRRPAPRTAACSPGYATSAVVLLTMPIALTKGARYRARATGSSTASESQRCEPPSSFHQN